MVNKHLALYGTVKMVREVCDDGTYIIRALGLSDDIAALPVKRVNS